MKLYGKFMFLGFLWGVILSSRAVVHPDGEYTLVALVINIGFDILPACNQITMLNLLEAMVPYYVFIIIFGTFIYQHFCWSSPYIFTRCSNRTKWLCKEFGWLLFYSAGYMLCMVLGRVLPYLFFSDLYIDKVGLQMLLVLFGIMVLWLFSAALLCNTLSILKSGVWGTFFTLGISMCGVAVMAFVNTNNFTAVERLKLHLNYCAHLVFGWHSLGTKNMKEMNQLGAGLSFGESYLYLGVVALVILLVSIYVVQRKDVIGNLEAR